MVSSSATLPVDAGRASGIEPSSHVTVLEDDDGYERHPVGLQLQIDPAAYNTFAEPHTFQQARELAAVIDGVLAAGGDARTVTPELRQWRDRLPPL
jgi:hypothetical protein